MKNCKFRGISLDTGKMVYGCGALCTSKFEGRLKSAFVFTETGGEVKVNPDTLAQFTGILDRKGAEIYTGDIVDKIEFGVDMRYIVHQLDSGFTLVDLRDHNKGHISEVGGDNVNNYDFWNNSPRLKVIGNIHENPELLTT